MNVMVIAIFKSFIFVFRIEQLEMKANSRLKFLAIHPILVRLFCNQQNY